MDERDPQNPYLPDLSTVIDITAETPSIKTLKVILNDSEKMKTFAFEPGQVAQLSVFGAGEATFVINSPPDERNFLQFSVMKAGEVTSAIHNLAPGDQIGIRGPLGNWFPYDTMKGRNVLFVGGGIGLAPLRTLILHLLHHRENYGEITILYGARTYDDLCYKDDLRRWQDRSDVNLVLTVDNDSPGVPVMEGMVPDVLLQLAPKSGNTVAITCGHPIMIRYTLRALEKLGFNEDEIITTLEARMKCGIGLCGRCNIGSCYICKDGPVFTLAQLHALKYEI
jgi:sulfhydrogenase subunit gamma (sulfur reductase)